MSITRILFAGLFVLLGLGLLSLGHSLYEDTQELSEMEPVEPGEVDTASGEVVVEGTARAADTEMVESKYEGRSSIAHEWREEREREPGSGTTGDDSMTDWTTADSGSEIVDFYVEGDSGEAFVDTDSASVSLSTRVVERETSRRYSEGTLQPGDEVFVRGQVNEEEEGVSSTEVRDGDHSEAVAEGYLGAVIVSVVGLVFVLVGVVAWRRDS